MSPPRVLIVDDNLMNLELVSFLLQAADIDVSAASNADAALRAIAEVAPDLILMDIQLPDIDGLTLTRQIKADPRTRATPVVALTAYAMKGDEARMLEAGCDGYIAKPIDVTSFASRVKAYLARRAASSSS
ncbi:MAG: response regulator [Burkholderiales bacterium]|jgi:CheY-like chemotaxis protein|nr:MAG: response regulator [Burkholderiales bacterium]